MDVSFKGKQSDATNGNYNKLENKGILYLRDIKTTSDYLPKPFIIKEGEFVFNQDKMNFKNFKANYGQSDFMMNGYMENVINFALSENQVLKGNFKVESDFIQVNALVNQAMVQQALAWLTPAKTDQILDLYCGIGNFSLALAKHAGMVVGLEGVAAMVTTASQNASFNGLENTHFAQVDLHLPWPKADWNQPKYQKVLLDPARAGALGAIDEVARLKPAQVLYVSCNPTTFARDAKVLLAKGYRLDKIGMMDMFPYTSHLELMALFSHTRQ